jgi:hypothetical protein
MKNVDPVEAVVNAVLTDAKPDAKLSEKELTLRNGPLYPELGPSVEKFRRLSKNGISHLTRDQRVDYANAIETRIRALQRQELQAGRPAAPAETWVPDQVGASVRRAHAASLAACAGKERRARKPEKWQAMYDEAMEEKRAREAAPPVVAAPEIAPVTSEPLDVVTVGDVRYGALSYIVRIPVDAPIARLIEDRLKCRRSRQHKGFVLSSQKFAKLQQLVAQH